MRKIINNFLRPYRLKLVPLKEDFEPVQVEKKYTSPLCLNYLANKQPVLLDVPLEKGRALPLFTYAKDTRHPYVVAVKNALNATDPRAEIQETLQHFYRVFRPASAARIIGLHDSHVLNNEPHWAVVLPWNTDSVDEWKGRISKSVAYENKTNGSNISIRDGWAWAGPVSEHKLMVETERLYRIFDSIRAAGYKRHDGPDGDIQAFALVDEKGEWVWQAQFGMHRAAVVAGMSYLTIPVRFSRIIYRSEVKHWPNVVSGLYTKEEALRVFDMIFYGNYPAAATNWLKAFTASIPG